MLETSIATWLAPALRIRASRRAISSASGVVCSAGINRSPKRCPTVPIVPQRGAPSAPSTADWTRCAVVVFPLVPVMPTTSSAKLGCP